METTQRLDAPHGPDCTPETARTIPYLIAFGVTYVGAIVALRFLPLPQAAQVAVALLPVPFFGFYILRWMRAVRRLDELERLILLEALAIAFPLALLLVLTLGLLELSGAIRVGVVDMLKLWPMIFWLYFVGLFAARKRYR